MRKLSEKEHFPSGDAATVRQGDDAGDLDVDAIRAGEYLCSARTKYGHRYVDGGCDECGSIIDAALAPPPAVSDVPEVEDFDVRWLERLRDSNAGLPYERDCARRILALCEWARTHTTTRTEGEGNG